MNLNKNKSSFDDLIKGLGFFGSVEILKILIQIIRSKFMAILLGPAGIGLYGLYITSIGLISSITNFGLDVSGVKFLSSIKNNPEKKYENFNLYKSLIIITSILGFTIVIIFSPILSYFTFQDFDQQFVFFCLSIYVLFYQLGNGNNTFLRALRRKKKFAKSNLTSEFLSLIISVLFYYFLGIEGIIPALIFTSLIYFVVSQILNRENSLSISIFSLKDSLNNGKEILKTGITYSFSGLLIIISSLIIQVFIKYHGDLVEVGLYIAAIAIVNNYVNLIFRAMAIDFFPKLSEIKSIQKSNKLVNDQSILALLFLSPILIILITFIDLVLYLLYSSEFYEISFLVQLLIIGVLFRTMSWSISYFFLSRGNTKLFFKSELFFNIFYLLTMVISYSIYGLNGLGFAFILSNSFYLFIVYRGAHNKYKFNIDIDYIKLFIIQILFIVILILNDRFDIINSFYSYMFNTLIFILSLIISIKSINSRSNIFVKIQDKIWIK